MNSELSSTARKQHALTYNFIEDLAPSYPVDITQEYHGPIVNITCKILQSSVGNVLFEDALHARSINECKRLLKNGCKNEQNDEQETPLHLAIAVDWVYLCAHILKKNPDLLLENSRNQTPIELAHELGRTQLVVKLLEYTASLDEVVPEERQVKFLCSLWYNGDRKVISLAAKKYLPKPFYHSCVYTFSGKSVRSLYPWISTPRVSAGLVRFSFLRKDWGLVLYHFIGKKAFFFTKNRKYIHKGSFEHKIYTVALWTWRNFWQREGLQNRQLFEMIDRAIGAAINIPSNAALAQKIQQGKEPVIIPTGWSGHSLTVVFVDSLLFISNRGEKAAHQVRDLTVYRIDNTRMTEEMVAMLIGFKNDHDALINEVGEFIFDTLPKALDAVVDDFCELIHSPACQPPRLTKPICVAANLRGAISSILLSQAIKVNNRWNLSIPVMLYKDYTASARYSILNKFLYS